MGFILLGPLLWVHILTLHFLLPHFNPSSSPPPPHYTHTHSFTGSFIPTVLFHASSCGRDTTPRASIRYIYTPNRVAYTTVYLAELINKEVQWNPLIQTLMGQKKVSYY